MAVEGYGDQESIIRGLYEICKATFQQANPSSLQDDLVRSITEAVKHKVLDPKVGKQLQKELKEAFKGRSVEEIPTGDRKKILEVFQKRLSKTEEDLGYGSAESVATASSPVEMEDLDSVIQRQKELQQQVKARLDKGSLEDLTGQKVRVNKIGKSNEYSLGLEPHDIMTTITPKELKPSASSQEDMWAAPAQFTVDHITGRRTQYLTMHFPHQRGLVVRTVEDAEHLQRVGQGFVGMIAEGLSEEQIVTLYRGVCFCTTQHIGNGVVGPLLAIQRGPLSALSGFDDCDTRIASADLDFIPGKKSNEFTVVLDAEVITYANASSLPSETSHQRMKEVIKARTVRGCPPAIVTRVKATVDCRLLGGGHFETKCRDGTEYVMTLPPQPKI